MEPILFKQNRVWRIYKGGKMIDTLRHKSSSEDGYFPEDWIASTVEANNPQNNVEREGISKVIFRGEEIDFDILLRRFPEALLGQKHVDKFGATPGFLTKLLDSAIRLPIQAHPNRRDAKEIYQSDFGKSEVWIVLGTRSVDGEEPCLYLGFNETLNKDKFISEAMTGNMAESLKMVHRHQVKSGDILMLHGGLVHAIGPGVFLIEIMEPTDLVSQPELYCGEKKLTNQDRFGLVDPQSAMKVFDYSPTTEKDAWNSSFIAPQTIKVSDGFELFNLLERNEIRFFGAEKLILKKSWPFENHENICRVGIVCKGSILINYNSGSLAVNQGDAFLIPASLNKAKIEGSAEVVFALPPIS